MRSRPSDDELRLQRLLQVTPSSFVDPLTPWVMPWDSSQKLAASGVWFSFGLSSAMLHGIALGFSLGLMPFALSVCALFQDIKPIEEKPPEVIEMAMVVLPPPPPEPPPEKPPEPPPPPKPLGKRIARANRAGVEEVQMFAVLGMIGNGDDVAVSNIFGSLAANEIGGALDSIQAVEGGVEGGVVGGVVGGTASAWGTGEGRGGAGLGGLGAGDSKRVVVSGADPQAVSCVRRLAHRLQGCVVDVVGVDIFVADRHIDAVSGGPDCLQRALVTRPCDARPGNFAIVLTP